MGAADAVLTQSLLAESRSAPAVRAAGGSAAARRAAEEFEQFFMSQMLEQMFAGIPTDGPFGGGNAEGIFRSLQNTEYAKIIGRAGGIGIADAVYREILKLQESESP